MKSESKPCPHFQKKFGVWTRIGSHFKNGIHRLGPSRT
jgi:hypothetical protein